MSQRTLSTLIVGALASLVAASGPGTIGLLRKHVSCSLVPGSTHMLMHVEQDTTLPHASVGQQVMSLSTPRDRPGAPSLADASTLMPSARVRLLQLDSVTRAELNRQGVRDSQPIGYIQAFSYDAGCRPLVWTDTVPWVRTGDTGYALATLAPRSKWIDGRPMFVIANTWAYPYPRRGGMYFRESVVPESLATAEAVFHFSVAISAVRGDDTSDTTQSRSALQWAREHVEQSEREPIRHLLREAVLRPDMRRIEMRPSRLRGTYRVTLQSGDTTASWWFRTVDKPAYAWVDPERPRTSSQIVAVPHTGYSLVGYSSEDSIREDATRLQDSAMKRRALVWLGAGDRPSMPGNERVMQLPASLTFNLKAAPQLIWSALEGYIPALSPIDSAMRARMKFVQPLDERQPRLSLTLRIANNGTVAADTMFVRDGRRLHVTLVRVDTLAVPRAWE